MKRASIILIGCWPSFVLTQDIHIVHCLAGCPTGTPATNDLIVREIYALSNNEDTKFADWVAYRVTRETIGTSNSLQRNWQADDLLDSSDTLERDDYRGANGALDTDRGHQAPLASFAGTHFWRVTNILSNITPQKSDLNQGAWVDLESAVREAAYDLGEIYVVTGPLYDPNENQIELPQADESHMVPTGYFKVISTDSGRLTAFMFDQDADNDMDYCEGIFTIQEVEEASGLDIFPQENTWPNGDVDEDLGC